MPLDTPVKYADASSKPDQVKAQVPALSRMHRWAALMVLLFAQFVLSIDLTVLNVALPSMTAELQPTSDEQLWIVDAYSLVLAGLLVSASSLSDRIGRKKMLLGGALVFCIGCALIVGGEYSLAGRCYPCLFGVRRCNDNAHYYFDDSKYLYRC